MRNIALLEWGLELKDQGKESVLELKDHHGAARDDRITTKEWMTREWEGLICRFEHFSQGGNSEH